MKQPSMTQSLMNAWRGMLIGMRGERNFRIHLAITALVIVLAAMLPLQSWQRVALCFAVMIVLVLELINSSVERLVDMVQPSYRQEARDVKDLMAGAVLLASLFSAAIGLFIFLPFFSAYSP